MSWSSIINGLTEAYQWSALTVAELKAGKNKYGLKQKYLTSANDKYFYTPIYKTVGSASSSSGSTASTGSATANCVIRATVANGKVITQAFVGRSLQADQETMLKTGITATEKYKVVAGVAACCGFSLGWDLAKDAMNWIEEHATNEYTSNDGYVKGFDWGPSAVNNSDKVYTIGHPTNDGVVTYIERNLFERLVIQLNLWKMWDIEPGGQEPLEPTLDEAIRYDFLGRFPAVPQNKVSMCEDLINEMINQPANEGERPKLDENTNALLGVAIDRSGEMTLTQFASNYWDIKERSPKCNGEGVFVDAEVIYKFRPGALLQFFYQYRYNANSGAMKQYPQDEIYLTTDWIYSRTSGSGEYYDNFGYYRPIEKVNGKIKLGAITDEYNSVVIDENAIDLRHNTIPAQLPSVWANRIYVSTPDFDQPYRGDDGWPSYAALNEKLVYLPVKIPGRTPDPNSTQSNSFTGLTDTDVLDTLIDNVPPTLPGLGTDPSPIPTNPPSSNPNLPTLPEGINKAGLIHLYKVTDGSGGELEAFHTWLWTANVSQNLVKVVQNPMDAIIGLHAIFATPTSIKSVSDIILGNLLSGTSATLIEQFQKMPCGGMLISPYFKNINDIVATKIQLYLPFIGFVDIDPKDVIYLNQNGVVTGRYLYVDYNIDFLTGACAAYVSTRDSRDSQESDNNYLYQFSGNCAVEVPVTSANYSGIIRNVIAAAGGYVGASEAIYTGKKSLRDAVIGSGVQQQALSSGTDMVASSQIPIQRSGNCGANVGAMGPRRPYLIITRNVSVDAENRRHFEGLPQNMNVTLGALSGYTRVKYINLEGLAATEDEKADILAKLQEGVFI